MTKKKNLVVVLIFVHSNSRYLSTLFFWSMERVCVCNDLKTGTLLTLCFVSTMVWLVYPSKFSVKTLVTLSYEIYFFTCGKK